jgi:hypothetical protein
MSQRDFEIIWKDSGCYPQIQPNPSYPDGINIRCGVPDAKQICKVDLAYPAPRCGVYLIHCKICDMRVAITTAGRRDDPCSVEIPCKL